MPPKSKHDAKKLIESRHPEWTEHQREWRFRADSLEGGDRYKHADYALDPLKPEPNRKPWYIDPLTSEGTAVAYQQIVDRNLIPHQSETGPDGRDVYTMRLARTPVPNLVERAVESHLTRIFAKEIVRQGPPLVDAWWESADGRGTSIDQWLLETAWPLLLVLGQLDVLIDHPPAPEGVSIENGADLAAYGLNDVIASVILPENLPWWRLDERKARYIEALVFECCEGGGSVGYRHWTETESNYYTAEGEYVPERSREHNLGFVPIVRVFDRRKPRCDHVGRSRYASTCDLQRAVYNLDSEQILTSVLQSAPILSGPEEMIGPDADIKTGPDGLLPKKKHVNGGGYEGWEFVDPPKGATADIRMQIQGYKDEADRDAQLAKPAGLVAGGTTAQSGVSKLADKRDGNDYLARIAATLAEAEERLAGLALRVATDGRATPADVEAVEVEYPKEFDLYTAEDLATALDDLQRLASTAGALPKTQSRLLKRLVAIALPGISAEDLDEILGEIDAFMAEASAPPPADPAPQPAEVLDGQAVAGQLPPPVSD